MIRATFNIGEAGEPRKGPSREQESAQNLKDGM
jgi:hypothetical protein